MSLVFSQSTSQFIACSCTDSPREDRFQKSWQMPRILGPIGRSYRKIRMLVAISNLYSPWTSLTGSILEGNGSKLDQGLVSHSLRSGRHMSARDKPGLVQRLEPCGASPLYATLISGVVQGVLIRTLSFAKDCNSINTSLSKMEYIGLYNRNGKILKPKCSLYFNYGCCYGSNCVPQKDMSVLILGICECDLIWKQGFYRYHQIKVRSYLIRLGPNPMTGIFKRENKDTDIDTKREKEAEVGVMCLQTKEYRAFPATPAARSETQNRFSPRSFRERKDLPTP